MATAMTASSRPSSASRENGVSDYVGDGLNRWPAVHRPDAAQLDRLAIERTSAGVRFHGVDDEGVPARDIAGVIGRRPNLPVVAKSPDGDIDPFACSTSWAGSARIRHG